jgi:Ca2+-transporting ATPase
LRARFSLLQIFLTRFKSVILWILIVAGAISGVLGEMLDALATLAIVVPRCAKRAENPQPITSST